MKIGNVEINGHVILGPMAGVTTLAYRDFCKPFGVALSYSEMISDCGLAYGNQKTMRYFVTSKEDRPVGLQLFGSDIEMTLKAIDIIEQEADYDILDINLGCPVHKVVQTGAGSAWLKDPEGLGVYMKKVVEHSHKPVTAKIRLGWDENSINFEEICKVLVDAGVSMITIHARTSRQLYMGVADYEALRGLGDRLPVPLCISGDIFSVEAAMKAVEITKAQLVMVARGSLGNPRLITNIERAMNGEELLPEATLEDQVAWAEDFSKRLLAQLGERDAIMQLRGLIPHFFKGFPGYKKIRAAISMNIKTYDDLQKIFNGIKNRSHL
ncbi:MAG: tRNA-dihydrouridine synthase [Bacilli bacterium]|nr:tRNA-dihydrouridine synthase [Bacilli bacterium]